jgi:hypothetical protein
MLLSNPKIDGTQKSVEDILKAVNRTATSLPGSGIKPVPPWDGSSPWNNIAWHYQGIALFNSTTLANACMSASSTEGYFACMSQGSASNPVVQAVVAPNSSYYHCAGIQMFGTVLPAPLESGDDSNNGLVDFYDVSDLASPVFLYTLTMPAKKASATAITNYTDSNGVEQCLMMVYEYDHQEMYIYQALASQVGSGASAWTRFPTYNGSAFQTGDEYQSFGLITQTNDDGTDVPYLLGFREDEELWLWSVATNTSYLGKPTLVAKYTGWNGSDWRNGMGLQIVNNQTIRLVGTDKDPSGHTNWPSGPASYTFNLYIYS